MAATSLDLSQIKTDALNSASTFRDLVGLGANDPATFNQAIISGGTITSSTPVLDATQTWNDAAVTFTGMKLDVTDTASASDSLLMDLHLDASSRFKVKVTYHNTGDEACGSRYKQIVADRAMQVASIG